MDRARPSPLWGFAGPLVAAPKEVTVTVVTKPVSPETFDTPKLPSGLVFADLYRREGLLKIDVAFMDELGRQAPELHARVLQARHALTADVAGQSDLIIAV